MTANDNEPPMLTEDDESKLLRVFGLLALLGAAAFLKGLLGL